MAVATFASAAAAPLSTACLRPRGSARFAARWALALCCCFPGDRACSAGRGGPGLLSGEFGEGHNRGCSWHWSRRGQPIGSIGVSSDGEYVTLVSHFRKTSQGQWKPIEQRVRIIWTECNFGGHRPWFCCPGRLGRRCGRRVALLYLAGDLFACRHCYGLVYESQGENWGRPKAEQISEDQDAARRQRERA
jgi:hypothetical protein